MGALGLGVGKSRAKSGKLSRLPAVGFFCALAIFASVAGPAFAALDIVPAGGNADGPVYVLKNTSTGKVMGTFWDRENETSDYGFESSIVPDFAWSKNRDYVAVTGGASRNRAVSLYRVVGNSLKEIEVPQLDEQQAAPLDKIKDSVADGTDAVRWQGDGTLLLHFWSAGRVRSESETQKTADVWADLEVAGDKAAIVGVSSEEPSAQPGPPPPPPVSESAETTGPQQGADGGGASYEADGFKPARLAGTHAVQGKNPDGTAYKGEVEIRIKSGLVLLQWKIGKDVSHGTGVVVGNTLGVSLDNGVAIYQIVGHSGGLSLLGCWATEGSSTSCGEAILVGEGVITKANFPTEKFNGEYRSLRESGDAQVEGTVTISGGDTSKKVLWATGGKTAKCQGLALGDGLAIISPAGLSVFSRQGDALEGRSVTSGGGISQESLIPIQ